ncbi:MAG: glycerol-3-phosphate responsive antiterminator [Clostridia bacterium]|nr:glycerol-3-phosphate responsive antiterminator [Clostridia bacterium]
MEKSALSDYLERSPVIAAVSSEQTFHEALDAPPEVLFYQNISLPIIQQRIEETHAAGKRLFVHIDLAEGLGKDRTGVEYLASCGIDGLISTRGQLIRYARECGLLTVQRFFLLDTQSLSGVTGMVANTAPDYIELIPGVIGKAIERFAGGRIPVIAGGLIETKAEVTEALRCGAAAVSTSRRDLWYL